MIDLNAIRSRVGSISESCLPFPLRESLKRVLKDDLPALIREVEEHRASLAAKQETLRETFGLGDARGIYLP